MANGIADSPNVAVNTAPIAAIGSEQPVAPALNDFMQAFRSGFITVDDLTRRTKQSAIDTSNLQTTLSANDLTRRKTAAELQLLPGQQAEAQVQQDIAATTAPARLATATKQAQDAELLATDPDAFHAQRADETVRQAWILRNGPLPRTLTIKNPEKPPTLTEWTQTQIPKIEARQRELAAQFANDEAGYVAAMRADDIARQQEYLDFVASNKEIKVPQGTPAYAEALQKQVQDRLQKDALSGINISTYQKGQEAEAVARGERAGGGGKPPRTDTTKRINPTTGLEEEVLIRTDPTTGEVLGETVIAKNAPKLTEVQSRAQLFEARLAENEATIDSLTQKGFDPAALSTTAQRFVPNRLASEEVQQYETARDNWISAVLRNESGAAITPPEYPQARKEYFPRDGDGVEVIAQKKRLRRVAEDRIRAAAGPGVPLQSPASQGTGAPTKLPNGTVVPVGGSIREPDGRVAKWDGTTWILVQ